MLRRLARAGAAALRALLPLAWRKRLVLALDRVLPGGPAWLSGHLLADLAARDVGAYHRFLWSRHLSYAHSYDAARRFGYEKFPPLRKRFFAELQEQLAALGVDPKRDVRSVLEIGCSSGYQLRYLETDVFTSAERLDGVDIDGEAIRAGREALEELGSRVRLVRADMRELEAVVGARLYDVVLCAGVLMYASEASAAAVVKEALAHTRILLAVADPPNPARDNREMAGSAPSPVTDEGWLNHNVDAMVERAGGRVVARRWEGGAASPQSPKAYFVFARSADAR
jgi:SAM-dependent methyltransferase